MSLKVTRRAARGGALTISGTVGGQRIRQRAQSDDRRLAEEEAAAIEAEILRTAWHGERRGARSFGEAVVAYIETAAPNPATKKLLNRILRALGPVASLAQIDQEALNRARRVMLAPEAAPGTVLRNLIVPLRAVMLHAQGLGWCDAPRFRIPKQPQGRTLYLLPEEADRLLDAAAPHLRVLLILLLCTGARMSEALELLWRDVDLQGARAIFWKTKNGRRRVAHLPARAVVALASLPHRDGAVIRTQKGQPYVTHDRQSGGQIKTAWAAALRRAGLDPELSPHDLRHSWASWHYAVNRDLMLLRTEGQWSSVALVERYAHLLPAGQEGLIRAWWHQAGTSLDTIRASA